MDTFVMRLAFNALRILCRALGRRLSAGVGVLLGLLYGALNTRRGRVLRHLILAFGPSRARDVLPRYNEHIGLLAVEYAHLSIAARGEPVASGWVKPDGIERLQETIRSGRGVIVVTGHLGNWEMTGYALASGIPLHSLYRQQKPAFVDAIARDIREKSGMEVREKADSMRWSMRVLRNAGALGALLDQDGGRGGVFVPFFGALASTLPTAARLARRTGAAMFAIGSVRQRDRVTLRLYVGPRIEPAQTGEDTVDTLLTPSRCNRAIERMIEAHPGQWLWSQHRWRTRPSVPQCEEWKRARQAEEVNGG